MTTSRSCASTRSGRSSASDAAGDCHSRRHVAREVLDYDNVAVSPGRRALIWENAGGEQFLRGLTHDGKIFDFAQNLLNHRNFVGARFNSNGRTLFLNITGPTTDAGTEKGLDRGAHSSSLASGVVWYPTSRIPG